jgi:hypothetical protein
MSFNFPIYALTF